MVDDNAALAMQHERITELVTKESAALLRYFARRVTAVEDAADLLGETMVVIWRRTIVVPDDRVEARMWIYGVARKVLASHNRGSLRHRALTDELRAELAVKPAAAALDGTDGPVDTDVQDHVRMLLTHLRAIDREIVQLVHWEGFTLQEVATMLQKPSATIRSRYARARRQLQRVHEESQD